MASTPMTAEQLAKTDAFSGMDRPLLNALFENATLFTLRSGEILFSEGTPYQDQLYILLEGKVRLQRQNNTIYGYRPGQFIGLSSYIDHLAYTATAQADEVCHILRLSAQKFAQLEKIHPQLAKQVDQAIGQRIRSHTTTGHTAKGALAQPVYKVMTSPIVHCNMETRIIDAYQMMQERQMGSLAVLDPSQELVGIITYADLCKTLIIKQADPATSVTEAVSAAPITISQRASLWEAEDKLQQHQVKYLAVLDDQQPVGIVSQSDLFKARRIPQSREAQSLQHTPSLAALQAVHATLPDVAQRAYNNHHYASQAVKELSEFHLAIQRRCVELTLQDMASEGQGHAPRNYCLLIMGSGGRYEMLLNPDQDNGLIIDDQPGPLNRDEKRWYKTFSEKLNLNLDQVGYILCPGNIMARNPMFHKTLTQWKKQISHMVDKPNIKSARWANIVFDFTTLYGDDGLARQLREHLLTEIKHRQLLLEYMVEDDAQGQPPLGFFNRLITSDDESHKGTIDIKRNGLRLIVDAARVYALYTGLSATNTRERLHQLVHQGILSRDLVGSVMAAFEELLDLLLLHQIKQMRQGQMPNKYINPEHLSWQARSVLRISMRAIKRLQDQLQGRFGRSPL